MDENEEERIHQMVKEKVDNGQFNHSTWIDWKAWLNEIGLKYTKERGREVLFFGLSYKQNPEDWRDGAGQLAEKAGAALRKHC